jgi:hypothetical protein
LISPFLSFSWVVTSVTAIPLRFYFSAEHKLVVEQLDMPTKWPLPPRWAPSLHRWHTWAGSKLNICSSWCQLALRFRLIQLALWFRIAQLARGDFS